MNIASVNAASSSGTGSANNKSYDLQTIGTKGQVVDGLISKVSDKISINFSGKEVTVSKSAVQNAKEGEIRKFEIMDVSETSIVLKEVGNSMDNTGNVGIICTTVNTEQAATKERLNKKEEESNSQVEEQSLEDISKRLTSKDYASLVEEGLYLEAYELTRLDRALVRIKTQREQKDEGVKNQIKNQEEYRNQIKKVIAANLTKSGMSEEIAEKLIDANMPVTAESILKITNATELAYKVTPISDKTMCYLIGNELEPTIQNLYHGQYSGSVVQAKEEDSAWEEIKNQAENVLTKAGMELNENNLGKAKWLFQNQLPITEDTLNTLSQLQQINEGLDKNSIVDKIVNTFAKGIAPEQTLLVDNLYDIAKQAVEDFANVTDKAILEVTQKQQEINLKTLMQQISLTENQTVNEEFSIPLYETTSIDIKAVTAKRQLEEIRLKMTVEAGQKLMGKGIDLNTADLQRVVEGLREIEDQYYQNLLKEGQLSVTDGTISLLRETTEKVNELKFAPSYILGTTLEQKSIQTVDTLVKEGSNLKAQLEKAGSTYETLMTAPRKDMGDSIEKAFQNVDNILTELDMEATEANQRAVRILGYNGMEITKDSIMNMKEYDAKVNYLMNNLHPAVTVEMIRSGQNPINMPIDQLNQQITQIREELGVTEEERYSKFLWKLEKNKEITEEERKSFIGIYRLLNNVEKTNGAAIGSVVQAEQEMTLKNLLTAVRTRKSNGVDQKVDDDFGALESLTFKKESITDQIQTSYQSTSSISYYDSIVKSLEQELDPKKLMNLENNNLDAILNQSIESLYEEIKGQDGGEDIGYYEEKVMEIRNLAEGSRDSIEFLTSYQIPVTLQNISAVNQILQNGQSIFKNLQNQVKRFGHEDQDELEQVLSSLSDGLEDAETMQATYDKIGKSMEEIINQEYGRSNLSTKDLADLKLLSNGIELANSLSKQECYEIPILTGDRVTQINLTIVSGEKENGKVQVSLESEQLGKVQAEFVIRDQSLKGLMLCDNREGLDAISGSMGQFEEMLNASGVEVKNINIGINSTIKSIFNRPELKEENQESSTDTKTLYQVAKAFVQHMKHVEDSNLK